MQTFQSSNVRPSQVLFSHIHQMKGVIAKAGWWAGSNYYTETSWPHLGRTTVDHRLDPCLEHQEGVLSPESRVITCESSGGGEGKKKITRWCNLVSRFLLRFCSVFSTYSMQQKLKRSLKMKAIGWCAHGLVFIYAVTLYSRTWSRLLRSGERPPCMQKMVSSTSATAREK